MDAPTLSDPLHALVLLYLAVANGDDIVDEHERSVAVAFLLRWEEGLDLEAAQAVVDTAWMATRSGLAADAETLARSLRPTLSPARRRLVLSDLGRLAQADGHVSIGEAHVIGQIRSVWGESV